MLPFGSSSFGQLEGSQDYAAAPSQLLCLVFFLASWKDRRTTPQPLHNCLFCFVASVKDRRTTPQPLHTAFFLDHCLVLFFGQLEGSQDYAAAPSQRPFFVLWPV